MEHEQKTILLTAVGILFSSILLASFVLAFFQVQEEVAFQVPYSSEKHFNSMVCDEHELVAYPIYSRFYLYLFHDTPSDYEQADMVDRTRKEARKQVPDALTLGVYEYQDYIRIVMVSHSNTKAEHYFLGLQIGDWTPVPHGADEAHRKINFLVIDLDISREVDIYIIDEYGSELQRWENVSSLYYNWTNPVPSLYFLYVKNEYHPNDTQIRGYLTLTRDSTFSYQGFHSKKKTIADYPFRSLALPFLVVGSTLILAALLAVIVYKRRISSKMK